MTTERLILKQGDWQEQLRLMPCHSVHCIITSPPYWGLRDYGVPGQLGLEATPQEYVEKLVTGFREAWRVLRDDGTLWLNLGDSYARNFKKGGSGPHGKNGYGEGYTEARTVLNRQATGNTPDKQLIAIPWRVALAMQNDGWYLRSDIVWAKPNPMPESVTDRPTRSHEYIFLLTKKPHYFYDHYAIKEKSSGTAHDRGNGVHAKLRKNGPNSRMEKERAVGKEDCKPNGSLWSTRPKQNENYAAAVTRLVSERNKRDVWTVASAPYKGAHFATFPPDLVRPCILAGTSARGCCPSCGAPYTRVVKCGELCDSDKREDLQGLFESETGKGICPSKSKDVPGVRGKKKKASKGPEHQEGKGQCEGVPKVAQSCDLATRATLPNIGERQVEDARSGQEVSSNPQGEKEMPREECDLEQDGKRAHKLSHQGQPSKGEAAERARAVFQGGLAGDSKGAEVSLPILQPQVQQLPTGDHRPLDSTDCGGRAFKEEHLGSVPPVQLQQVDESRSDSWEPTCSCNALAPVPCTVLDPFCGSGTVGAVAVELGRRAVLIDLSTDYADLAKVRTNVTPGLPLA